MGLIHLHFLYVINKHIFHHTSNLPNIQNNIYDIYVLLAYLADVSRPFLAFSQPKDMYVCIYGSKGLIESMDWVEEILIIQSRKTEV